MTGLGYVTMCMLRARPWLNERSHHARWAVLGSVSVYLTQRNPNLVASCLQRCFYKELNCPTSRWTTELHLVCAHHLFHTLRDDILSLLSLLSLLSASPSRSSSVPPHPHPSPWRSLGARSEAPPTSIRPPATMKRESTPTSTRPCQRWAPRKMRATACTVVCRPVRSL